MDPDFTIRLGNGLYMDSTGRYLPGPLDDVPTHPAPGGGLPIDPKKAEKALKGIAESLSTKDPATRAKLTKLGVPEELLGWLNDIAELSGKIAKVVPYISAVIAVGEFLGFLKRGKDPLLARIEALFKDLRHLIVAKDEKWINIEIDKNRNTINQAMNAVKEYIEEIENFISNPDDIKERLQLMRAIHQNVIVALNNMMNPAIWQSNIADDYFKWTWPFNLHYERTGSAPTHQDIVVRPAIGTDRFDHRVMVPTVAGMTQSYLTFIKTLVPEYRSSGEYSEFIADLALKIETLARFMRDQTLARTHFTESDFNYLYPQSPLWPAPWLGGYHVGAVDLCARSIPNPPVPQGFGWIVDRTGAKVDHGAVHYNWTPPAKLEKIDAGSLGIRYRILNPAECAAAANAQAEEDYATVLYASGYLNLVQLSGLLRHLYTAPSTSETVTGSVRTRYFQGPGTPVTVSSQSLFPFDSVSAPAQRYGQTSRGLARLKTQPRGRLRAFTYKVWLRALPALGDGTSDYGTAYHTRYANERDPRAPGTIPFSTLVCEYNGGVVGEGLLCSGKTPGETFTTSGTATFRADTFDWWVPTPDSAMPDVTRFVTEMRALGWASRLEDLWPDGGGTPAGPTPPSPASRTVLESLYGSIIGNSDAEVAYDPQTPQPVGQRRQVERHTVEVKYTVKWDALNLVVTLEGRPEDRNVDLYLVVEETIATGQILHTAFAVPLTGQITHVPQSFFDDEQEAIEAANAFWRDLIHRYAESAEVSPLDPIAQISHRELYMVDGLGRIAELVSKEQPVFLQNFMEERGISPPEPKTLPRR